MKQNPRYSYLIVLTLTVLPGLAQTTAGTKEALARTKDGDSTAVIIRRVADHIIETTSFAFVNNQTKEKFASTKGLAPSADVKADSKFNRWEYVNGVLAVGMIRAAKVLNDTRYSDYPRKDYRFIFDNLEYFRKQYEGGDKHAEYEQFFRMGALDDCGSMAAGLLDVYAFDPRSEYMDYLKRAADYIMHRQVKLPDSTLGRDNPHRLTLWADDLYMSVPFLARMGKLTGDARYFDFAIRQVENFNHYLFDPATGLFFHCYYTDAGINGVAHWGRANGWLAVAQTALLENLPADHPKRPELIALLLRQIAGFSRYQDNATGMWHQLLDKQDAYLESSVTAMFTYTVAKAVDEGWIDQGYMRIAKDGWRGLENEVTPDGELMDVCIGTGIQDNIQFYYTRPRETNDTHGLGAFLLAGSEMLRAENAEGAK